MKASARVPLLVAVAVLAACRIGPSSSVLADANLEVVVSNLAGGEEVRLEIAGQDRSTQDAPRGVLVMYATLPVGVHEGLVVVSGGETSHCAPFTVTIDSGDDAAVARVDAATAPVCDIADAGPGDGGVVRVFVRLAEDIAVTPCVTPPCTQTTTVDASGGVTLVDPGAAPQTGALGVLDLAGLLDAALSPAAAALFAGTDASCGQSPPRAGLDVLRLTLAVDGANQEETADISACLTGAAADLRARMTLARAAVP